MIGAGIMWDIVMLYEDVADLIDYIWNGDFGSNAGYNDKLYEVFVD